MSPKIPGVNPVTRTLADGSRKTYYYHRATGKRLEGEPGSQEFQRDLARASSPIQRKRGGGPPFASLVEDFLRSTEFHRCVATTRHGREVALRAAIARFDWMTVSDLGRRAIRDELFTWRDEMRDLPRKADFYMATFARLLSWAYDRGRIDFNHAQRIGRLTSSRNSRSDKVWTPDHQKQLFDSSIREIADVFRFALYTGARQADITRMTWAMFDGRWLVFTPNKTAETTAVKVQLPVYEFPPLATLLKGLGAPTEYLLTTENLHPWSPINLGKRFQEARDKAGLRMADLHFHDIRGTTVSELLKAGCTDAEVASITGHSLGGGTMLRDYAERSRTLAVNAYRKWWAMIRDGEKVVNIASAKRHKT